MTDSGQLPGGARLVRTTPEFDETTVPAGLLRNHRVAGGVWGNLVVIEGELDFTFAGESTQRVAAGSSLVIPPDLLHHVTVAGAVRFVVEFYEPLDTVDT